MNGDPSLSIDLNGFRNGTRTDLTYAACPPNTLSKGRQIEAREMK
jgi:hypothetical protein